jgi:hypothetical protein
MSSVRTFLGYNDGRPLWLIHPGCSKQYLSRSSLQSAPLRFRPDHGGMLNLHKSSEEGTKPSPPRNAGCTRSLCQEFECLFYKNCEQWRLARVLGLKQRSPWKSVKFIFGISRKMLPPQRRYLQTDLLDSRLMNLSQLLLWFLMKD